MPSSNCVEINDDWVKSRHSIPNGACLEWRKASSSYQEANCVAGSILVRDSQLGDGSPVLGFSPEAWASFTQGLK